MEIIVGPRRRRILDVSTKPEYIILKNSIAGIIYNKKTGKRTIFLNISGDEEIPQYFNNLVVKKRFRAYIESMTIKAINHETLHYIINQIEDCETSKCLDSLILQNLTYEYIDRGETPPL